ncbi:TlpA disulfide reductase family protein [Mucilaginibacter koreensis]
MKTPLYVCGLMVAAVAAISSCKNEKTFTVSGNVDNVKPDQTVFLVEIDSTEMRKVDSATINGQHTFQFKHAAPYDKLFKLQIGENIFDFIAKNGDDINFKSDMADSSHSYEVTGSPESEKIQEFNRIGNVYAAKNAKLTAQFEAEAQEHKNRDSLLEVYRPILLKNIDEGSKATLEFIDKNKNSLAAFYAALSVDPSRYEQQLVTYADDIKGKFDHDPLVQKFIQQMERVKPVSIGHKAPDFSSTTIDGKPIKLSDYKGKYVMLDFWASWCPPCRAENPNIVKQYAAFKDKGFNVLGLSLDDDKAAWQKAIQADHITWQQASNLKKWDDPTAKQFLVEAIPSNFIIDPNGVIVAKNITGDDLKAFLNKTFTKAQ